MATNSLKLQNVLYEISDEELDLLSEKDLLAFSRNELTEEELNELFGFSKKDVVKKIIKLDPQEDEDELMALNKSSLKKMLKAKREEAGEDTRGIFAKAVDLAKGTGDAAAGMFGNRAGTLLGGTETFDKKKRDGMKAKGKATAEKWLAQVEYQPLTDIYAKMQSGKFPNAASKGEFKTQAQEFQKIYDDIVKAHDADQIDTDPANVLIAVLRGVVIYFQDFAMNDKYYYKENRELSLDMMLLEAPEGQEEEEKIGVGEGEVSKNFEAAYGYGFPLMLFAGGLAIMGAGYAVNTPAAQAWLQSLKTMKKVKGVTRTVWNSELKGTITNSMGLGEVKPNEGIIRVVRRMVPGASNFGQTGGPSLGAIFGGGKNAGVLKLIKASMMNSGGAAGLDGLISSNADPLTTFVQGTMSGTGKLTPVDSTLYGIHPGKFSENVTTDLWENVPTEVTTDPHYIESDTFKNHALEMIKWAGPLLKTLGLGFLLAGAASGFMRWKGKGGKKGSGMVRGSRMSILKVLVDGFKDLKDEGKEDPDPVDDEVGVTIDLDHNRFELTVTTGDEEEKPPEEEEGADVAFENRYLPHMSMLVEYGISAPLSIQHLLSEVTDGFNSGQGFKIAGGPYPKDDGNFGEKGQSNMDAYEVLPIILRKWIKTNDTAKENEFSWEDITNAVKGAKFTLNDLRKEEEGPIEDEKISYDVDLEDDETRFVATKDGEEDKFTGPAYSFDEVPKDHPTASDEDDLAGIFRKEFDSLPTPPEADEFMKAAEDEGNPDTEYSVDDMRKEPEPEPGRPRLGLIRMDDDGLKLYRTRGGIGDKKYDDSQSQFQTAQDNAFVGNDTSPTTKDIEKKHVRQRRTPPAASLSYAQMTGRKGIVGRDLKKGVEVEPYFAVDKSAHSDIWSKRKNTKSMDALGKVALPKLGKDQKARSERMLKKVFQKFVAGKKKLTKGQANKIVSNYYGDKRKDYAVDKATRDKIINVLVGYGLVKESVDQGDNLLTESTIRTDQTFDRWATLAGIGTDK